MVQSESHPNPSAATHCMSNPVETFSERRCQAPPSTVLELYAVVVSRPGVQEIIKQPGRVMLLNGSRQTALCMLNLVEQGRGSLPRNRLHRSVRVHGDRRSQMESLQATRSSNTSIRAQIYKSQNAQFGKAAPSGERTLRFGRFLDRQFR